MPKEKKKRGRREEKKRKRQEAAEDEDTMSKHARLVDDGASDIEIKLDDTGLGFESTQDLAEQELPEQELPTQSHQEAQFYGLLDDEEQAYFKRADQMLELDQFADSEEQNLFLESLWRELNGKELKVACSQSCSRLLERLISLSSPGSLKDLHRKFSGHLLNLMHHRFASHCCEALFYQSAPIVTDELVAGPVLKSQEPDTMVEELPMEQHFLNVVNELEPDVGYLMTDQFGSHTLRVVLLALSGRPIRDAAALSMVRSKKKETITTAIEAGQPNDRSSLHRSVPASFGEASTRIKAGLVGTLDIGSLRTLSTHPLASPVLQLLLDIELARGTKQNAKSPDSVYRKLLPDTLVERDSPSRTFIQGLLYDPIGSHLLEVILRCAPGKDFKSIYRGIFQSQLSAIARNDVATYALIQALERLSAGDLQKAVEQLSPGLPKLIEQGQTSLVRCLIDRCRIRDVSTERVAQEIQSCFGSESPAMLPQILLYHPSSQDPGTQALAQEDSAAQERKKTHASLLAQSMLKSPGPLMDMITKSALSIEHSVLIDLAKDRAATHFIQALVLHNDVSGFFRRQFLARFLGSMAEMSVDSNASHVVDALWSATSELHFLREKMAYEMAPAEAEIKTTFVGRAVWRNWMMDLFERQKSAWIAKGRAADESTATRGGQSQHPKEGKPKRPIDLARARFANAKPGRRRRPFEVQEGVAIS